MVLHALGYLRAEALRRKDFPAVVALCRRILSIDPYHEECLRRLRDGLDVPPTDTTRRVYQRAARGELRGMAAA